MNNYGTLFGVGVGPGAPDLMTVRAINVLAGVDRIYAASSTKNDASFALAIAQSHLKDDIEIRELGFPMTRDGKLLEQAWEVNATEIERYLGSGKDTAFLTLGDPLLYSTFGYLLSTLRGKWPEIPIETVPGITSYQAAASLTLNILAESDQSLQIISGVCSESKLREQLACAENVVILKAYRNLPVIKKVLGEVGLLERALLASKIGQQGECVVPLSQVTDKPPYFSLVLVTSTKREKA